MKTGGNVTILSVDMEKQYAETQFKKVVTASMQWFHSSSKWYGYYDLKVEQDLEKYKLTLLIV